MLDINHYHKNTGTINIRIKKLYLTLPFNTTSPTKYTQQQMQNWLKYDEMKPYISNVEEVVEEIKPIIHPSVIYVESNEIKEDKQTINDINNLSLKELRILYPNIKSTSKKDFIKKIYESK